MSFELAVRLSEVLLGFALVQQSAEYIATQRSERLIFIFRLGLSLLLMSGVWSHVVVWLLFGVALYMLWRFQGPYNGGSDKMTLLILTCLALVHAAPEPRWQELAFGYLAMQLILSYVVSGWIKLRNPEWRDGGALADVFRFSAYPVSKALRGWSNRPRVLFAASWAVILFELVFPLGLLHPIALLVALLIAAAFHFSNACFFGLNRFFWIWISAYPALIWFQGRIFGGI